MPRAINPPWSPSELHDRVDPGKYSLPAARIAQGCDVPVFYPRKFAREVAHLLAQYEGWRMQDARLASVSETRESLRQIREAAWEALRLKEKRDELLWLLNSSDDDANLFLGAALRRRSSIPQTRSVFSSLWTYADRPAEIVEAANEALLMSGTSCGPRPDLTLMATLKQLETAYRCATRRRGTHFAYWKTEYQQASQSAFGKLSTDFFQRAEPRVSASLVSNALRKLVRSRNKLVLRSEGREALEDPRPNHGPETDHGPRTFGATRAPADRTPQPQGPETSRASAPHSNRKG